MLRAGSLQEGHASSIKISLSQRKCLFLAMNTREFFPSAALSLCAVISVISVGWWLVNCEIPGADWHQTQTLRECRVRIMDAVTKREGAHVGLLSRVRTLFHSILSGQHIMQKYSATFLSWFVPVRADNEEILISVHASLSFVTEQIVDGDHNTTMGLFTGFRGDGRWPNTAHCTCDCAKTCWNCSLPPR